MNTRRFNGHCHECNRFMPRCRRVAMKPVDVGHNTKLSVEISMCEDCRKKMRGQWNYAKDTES